MEIGVTGKLFLDPSRFMKSCCDLHGTESSCTPSLFFIRR